MLVALALWSQNAFACGGFAPVAGSLAASDAQQALIEIGTDSVSVTYRVRYEGDAADFAWVIAVPGKVTGVAEGSDETIDAVADASAPQIVLDPAINEEGCGCACSDYSLDKGGDFGDSGERGVEVTGSGYAGEYAYTTLAASDADGLITWLEDHGYDTTLLATAAGEYVADALDYEFVAVQLRPESPVTVGSGVLLTPLQITYGAAADGALHAAYPVKLGRTSTAENVRTELFILATGFATLSQWTAPENPGDPSDDESDLVGADYYYPDGMYSAKLLKLGGSERQMWLAFAGEYDGKWLTRYDAITYPSANTVDPVFTDSGEKKEAETIIYLQEESAYEADHPAGDTAWLGIGALALWGWRKRRQA